MDVLILGGTGFVGRHLVKYLVDLAICSRIRVVDKVIPSMAYLNEEFIEAFNDETVEFVQGNLTQAATVSSVFIGNFKYVFNLAGEMKYSQSDAVYASGIVDLSVGCAEMAAKCGVELFIEMSSCQLYTANKKPSCENDKLEPWTNIAIAKMKVENELKNIPNLRYKVMRPAYIYGPGDVSSLMPRLICATVYKELKEEMKFLWAPDLKVNCVHVLDVVRALWHLTTLNNSEILYNIVDHSDLDQSKICSLVKNVFDIEASCVGLLKSHIVKTFSFAETVESINEKHMQPWSEMCKRFNILNTPLSPYLDTELLLNNSLSVDGSRLEETGFEFDHPEITEDGITEMIDYFSNLNLFPI